MLELGLYVVHNRQLSLSSHFVKWRILILLFLWCKYLILMAVPSQICYHVLGLVHGIWTPIPRAVCYFSFFQDYAVVSRYVFLFMVYYLSQMKDYIATPKPNGYQSLHTTVIPFLYESMFRLEVQVPYGSPYALLFYFPIFKIFQTSSCFIFLVNKQVHVCFSFFLIVSPWKIV